MTHELSRFLYADSDDHKLNIQHIGTTLMVKNQSKTGSNSECIYRIMQDGLRYLVPYMGKRIATTSDEETFKSIIMDHYHKVDDLKNKEVAAQIDKLSPGCFIMAYNVKGTNHTEALTMHVF
jgi:hypothetical protein